MTNIAWTDGRWTAEPEQVDLSDAGMRVTAVEGSDAWRITSYGFIRDNAHALLAPFRQNTAIEVSFLMDFAEQFDQAGLYIRQDESTWIKAGVELSDGEETLGAVVTHGNSDWSLGHVQGWGGRTVTVRASRVGDAITIRARVDTEAWRLVRVAPLAPDADVSAGPFCCSPSRAGLEVLFTSWRSTEADTSLHPED